ncbi:MAG: family 20 glycosylhydrolase, partial [Ignavibacteriales bacterium]|nr:family 20 glycosylhydrolase [Ignavibacteriales bacterium]
MTHRIHSTSFLFLLLMLPANAAAQQTAVSLPVIPQPREVSLSPGHFRITGQTRIILGSGGTAEDRFAANQLNEHLIGLGMSPLAVSEENRVRAKESDFILIGSPRSARSSALLKETGLILTDVMKDEGYVLSVTSSHITVMGESVRGRYYGVMTLIQLITREKKSTTAPRLLVRDWPLLRMRGITDDLSRGQVSTLENFKKIIRFLSRHKLNVYSPYIEDIFEFSNHPLIGRGRGALTAGEIRTLDEYARQHHVELIPIFETLGHWENILLIPEYRQYAEFPGAHTLNVSDDRIYDLLDEMIGELAAAFSSPYFNMAADESWDVGLGASRERVAASDLATVHAEHYKRLFKILEKYGKRPLMYGDIILNHPAILEKIPRNVIIVDWQYWGAESYPSPAVFSAAGFPFVVSPAIWNFTGPFPNYLNTTINIRNFARDGYRNGTDGILTSNWNDYGGEALRELNYYGFAWTAECGWNPANADLLKFDQIFFTAFSGNERAGRLLRSTYQLLANVYTLLEWHEIWRHPLLPVRESILNNLWRFQTIEVTMPLVRELIREAESSMSINKNHLDYLRFVADLNEWFTRKIDAGQRIRKLQQDSLRTNAEQSAAIRTVAESLIPPLEALKREFVRLWLQTNREANLHLLTSRYDRQISYWKEIAANPLQSRYDIPSAWLYHPSANPYVRDSSATQVPRAFFRFVWDGGDSL